MNKGKTAITLIVIFLIIAVVIGGVFLAYNNKDDSPDYAAIIASMEKEINKNVETITQLEQTLELNGLELEDLIEKQVEYKTLIDDRTKTQKQYIERKEYITRTLTDKETVYKTKTQTKTEIEKEIETLTETLEKTQEENPSEIETITQIQEKIIEKEKEKVEVEQEIQDVEKVIVEYEKELIEIEERINVLTININQLNEMITELNVSVNLIGKTEEETRALVKSLKEENVGLAEELATAKVEIENLKANADAKYQNIIDNLNSDISNLQSRLTATENELNSYKEANISLQQTIINLENEIQYLKANANYDGIIREASYCCSVSDLGMVLVTVSQLEVQFSYLEKSPFGNITSVIPYYSQYFENDFCFRIAYLCIDEKINRPVVYVLIEDLSEDKNYYLVMTHSNIKLIDVEKIASNDLEINFNNLENGDYIFESIKYLVSIFIDENGVHYR